MSDSTSNIAGSTASHNPIWRSRSKKGLTSLLVWIMIPVRAVFGPEIAGIQLPVTQSTKFAGPSLAAGSHPTRFPR